MKAVPDKRLREVYFGSFEAADYRENSDLEKTIKLIIRMMAADDSLATETSRQFDSLSNLSKKEK